MSNPGDDSTKPVTDDDPVTDVIDVHAESGESDPLTGERRYTAPGFDAGFTQVIDRVPDEPTEFFGAAAGAVGPRAIPPRPDIRRRARWLRPLLVGLGAVVLVAAVGVAVVKHRSAAQQNAVRSAIESFDTAIRDGDLSTLRTITCGQTRQSYLNYDESTWADTHARVVEAKQYPVVASIDEVVVNGDHAEANVTSYMAYDPATKSTRSFDLQLHDGQWEICQAS